VNHASRRHFGPHRSVPVTTDYLVACALLRVQHMDSRSLGRNFSQPPACASVLPVPGSRAHAYVRRRGGLIRLDGAARGGGPRTQRTLSAQARYLCGARRRHRLPGHGRSLLRRARTAVPRPMTERAERPPLEAPRPGPARRDDHPVAGLRALYFSSWHDLTRETIIVSAPRLTDGTGCRCSICGQMCFASPGWRTTIAD
jgi:hypothetical protein